MPTIQQHRSPDQHTGAYAHGRYSASFSPDHDLQLLPATNTHFLKRPLGGDWVDLLGPYPLVSVLDAAAFLDDLNQLSDTNAISLVFVLDPFTKQPVCDSLRRLDCFHVLKPHYIADLSIPWRSTVRSRFKSYIRQGFERQQTRAFNATPDYVATFWPLYETLIERHRIHGVQTLSAEIVAKQLAIPGAVVTEARDGSGITGAAIWYINGSYAYLHLHAQTERAYQLRTSYALYATALDYMSDLVRWVDFGGAAGVSSTLNDGLAVYKKGWSTELRPSYLCGAILNRQQYCTLVRQTSTEQSRFFPAYRDPTHHGR